jgi:hypothetical protein
MYLYIAFRLLYSSYAAVKESPGGYFGMYVNLNRLHDLTASAVALGERLLSTSTIELDDDETQRLQAIVLPPSTKSWDIAAICQLQRMAAAGCLIVLLLDVSSISVESLKLLQSLAPSFEFISGDGRCLSVKNKSQEELLLLSKDLSEQKLLPPRAYQLTSEHPKLLVQHLQLQDYGQRFSLFHYDR